MPSSQIDLNQEPNQSMPNNVVCKEQLATIPEEFLGSDPKRPLCFLDSRGRLHFYPLRPFFYSAFFIVMLESFERFCYNGIMFSQESYLTGLYNPEWNAGMTPVQASTFVSSATTLTYLSPLVGGIMADLVFGDYLEIILGSCLFYIPGLILIAVTAVPDLLGSNFNHGTLVAGTLVLWPLGAGAMKSVVNVFGAKQYHPVLQSAALENFYVYYYMMINFGSLAGGILIPLVAETNQGIAFSIPVLVFSIGLLLFALLRYRYVQFKPDQTVLVSTFQTLGRLAMCRLTKKDPSNSSPEDPTPADTLNLLNRLLLVIPVASLTIPFALVYFQLPTVFVIQGTAMDTRGKMDAALMNNLDAISVIVVGFFMSQYLYPFLSRRYSIVIPTTTKFAIGTMFAAFSVLGLIGVDSAIRRVYQEDGDSIPVIWQTASYVFVGGAKVFCFSAVYEVTFVIAPRELKGLASSLMIIVIGSIPNILSASLYNLCEAWLPTSNTLDDYIVSSFASYLWLMFGITISASLALLMPPLQKWVEGLKRNDLKTSTCDDSKVNLEITQTDSV